jgi:hypothetical protein
MQRSYLVKSPVHFADFGFFVKVGDILVHDTSNANRLTVYRNGEVVKAVKQTSLGIAAMVKSAFIVEVTGQAPAPKTAPKAPQKPIVKPVVKPEAPKKEASAVNWGGVDMSTKSPKPAPAPGVPISKPEFDKLKESAKKPAPKPKPLELKDEEL